MNLAAREGDLKWNILLYDPRKKDLKMKNYDGFLLPALCIQNAFSEYGLLSVMQPNLALETWQKHKDTVTY